MNPSEGLYTLDRFRRQLYQQVLGRRKDTLFELMEAVLVSPGPTSLVRLSLAPAFRRRWPSASDSLADGTLDADACRWLFHTFLQQDSGERPIWAMDGTTWPRPAAVTSPERTWGHRVTPGTPQSGVVPAWEYQWLVDLPLTEGSWIRPLDVARRGPHAGTPTILARQQLQTALALCPPGSPRPVVTADSQYDIVALAQANLPCDLLTRLPKRRRFYRPPPPYRGRGRRPRHGPVFKLSDPGTHGPPDRSGAAPDPAHGTVRVDLWEHLHAQRAPTVPLGIIRISVERLPKSGKRPEPLWLAWYGAALPTDLLELWRWYARRFTIEHGFRFLKQELGWTTIRPRLPEAADRWSWLLALALWQLWLARTSVADQRLPWERPAAPAALSPGRVRRAFAGLLPALGSPARVARPRGKAPGRCPGYCPGARPRAPVLSRSTRKAA